MILLIELFVAALIAAVALSVLSAVWWLLAVLLVVAVVRRVKEAAAVRRFGQDIEAGRVKPISAYGCKDCKDAWKLCDVCAQQYLVDNPA